ncbi:hypothetical protein EGJ27_00545 [Pseudomonas sp. v388]|uniref:hypothetical protein n=1 Tax=Pseudomonas sp. v388 TaxID=2479849 RepID=UPI000F773C71|nr:hypothetical protein [Pseudomonas sp. v388]RRV10154.1 hypothetical protein EGJ27_00545 [Pseudomonas sp. v388]
MGYATFSDHQVKALVDTINTQGFAVLPDWATAEELSELRKMVALAVSNAGNSYVALNGSQAVAGSRLHDWGTSPEFLQLCQRVVAQGTGERPVELKLHQVLRCLIGDRGQRESLIFHYDSFVLTAIMPVCMPEKTAPGDLVMLPNHRPIRRSYIRNLLDKLWVDNRWTQRRLVGRHARHAEGFTRVQMQPGHMYLFWGYRSLHANLPADPSLIRATAVFHYQNVHGDRPLVRRLRALLQH